MQAKDLKPGWWFSVDTERCPCLTVWVEDKGINYASRNRNISGLYKDTEVTHHPECTGWDYVIPKPVRLEVGKRYVMRSGKVTGRLTKQANEHYPFGDKQNSWDRGGLHCCNYDLREHERDLVSEYVEPPAIDPGEGWRLLEDEEVVERGDQCLRSHWFDCTLTMGDPVLKAKQCGFVKAFRRRIAPLPCDCPTDDYVPFTQHTFRPHSKKWLYEKSQPSHWFRPQEIKPHAVLIGALWVEWDRLLAGFCFVGGGVCGEKHG